MSKAQSVTEQTFDQEVLSSDTPVLVDFWAAWCQPCLLVEPALEKIADERPGSIKLVKVNIDEEPELERLARRRPLEVQHHGLRAAQLDCPKLLLLA